LQLDGFMSHLKTTMAGGKVSMQEMQTNVCNRVGHLSNKLETMCGPSGASDQEDHAVEATENPEQLSAVRC